ncbi:MAG: 7-cyano-7-deazaguanine synthase QueC [Ktedonobacteraceae bacterium]
MNSLPAMILLSGGLDSVTALAWAQQQNFSLLGAISFSYGQRHAREIESAAAVAAYYNLPHQVVTLTSISGSRLTDLGDVPQGRDLASLTESIAPTYVPNRNMILLAYAAAHALLMDVNCLIGGWNAADAINYPDCREGFLESAQQTLRLATLRDFTIVRPLIRDDKLMIVRRALELRAPIHLTWTCYLGNQQACATCDACQLRIAAFQQADVIDPIPYANPVDWTDCREYTEVTT